MGSRSEWFCWEIMQCENSDDCPARKNPQKRCWEIACESGGDMHALNICTDCIVHIIKDDNSLLSNQEIMKIMEARAEHRLDNKDLPETLRPINMIEKFFG